MTNAAAIATLAGLAGAARVVVGRVRLHGPHDDGPARHAVERRCRVRAHAARATARGTGALRGEAHPDAAHARLRSTTTAGGALHHRRERPQGHRPRLREGAERRGGGGCRAPLAAAGHAAAMLLHYRAEYGLLDTLLPEESR